MLQGLLAGGLGIAELGDRIAVAAHGGGGIVETGGMLGRHLASSSILTLGLCVVALGNAIAGWGAYSGNWPMLLSGMFVTGSGAGLLNGETQKAMMMAIPRERAGIASGISTTARFSGILVGFAVLNAVVAGSVRLAASTCSGDGGCGYDRSFADAVIAGDLSSAIAGTSVPDVDAALAQVRQLYSAAFSVSLFSAAAIAMLSAILVWALMRSPKAVAGRAA